MAQEPHLIKGFSFLGWSIELLVSPLLLNVPNIHHGFGDRSEPLPEFATPYWTDRPTKTQVHGMNICAVHDIRREVGEADGLFTTSPNLLLTVVNADCFPVLLARSDGAAVMAIHVGWRGTLCGIVREAARLIEKNGDHPRNWVAAVGPGARSCCYEVSQELIEKFALEFPLPRNVIEPTNRKLNLPSVIGWQLQEFGFHAFSDVNACTICSNALDKNGEPQPTFFSFRRGDRESAQRSVIIRT